MSLMTIRCVLSRLRSTVDIRVSYIAYLHSFESQKMNLLSSSKVPKFIVLIGFAQTCIEESAAQSRLKEHVASADSQL